MIKRSLYQCSHAKVKGEHVYCEVGNDLGYEFYWRLSRGFPLEVAVCQGCLSYKENGDPIDKKDRGWCWKHAATEIQTSGDKGTAKAA